MEWTEDDYARWRNEYEEENRRAAEYAREALLRATTLRSGGAHIAGDDGICRYVSDAELYEQMKQRNKSKQESSGE